MMNWKRVGVTPGPDAGYPHRYIEEKLKICWLFLCSTGVKQAGWGYGLITGPSLGFSLHDRIYSQVRSQYMILTLCISIVRIERF